MGYQGEDRHLHGVKPDNVAALHVVVCKARAALRAAGVQEAIINVQSIGYIMPRTKAAEIRKIAEDHE